MRTIIIVTVPVVAIIFLIVWFPFQEDYEENPFVSKPTDIKELLVESGKVYAFPWTDVNCIEEEAGGCFFVKDVSESSVILVFNNFTITRDGSVEFSKLRFESTITYDGSEFTLFNKKVDEKNQEWAYAVLEGTQNQTANLTFLKYPAFITTDAKIYREVTVNLDRNILHDKYKIISPEEITLIGLNNFERNLAGGEIQEIKLNGKKVVFPYDNIGVINLPQGEHVLDLTINGISKNLCLEPLFEGKKMFLPKETAVKIISSSDFPQVNTENSKARLTVSLNTYGVSQKFWYDFDPVIEIEPKATGLEISGLTRQYHFDNNFDIFKFTPTVRNGGFTFPVIACISV